MPDRLGVFYERLLMGDVSAALETAAGAFGASALGITARGAGGVTQRWTGLDPSFEHAYLSHYHASDPWLAGGLRVGFDAGSCRTGTELVRPEERRRNPMLHELCKPFGLGDLQAGCLSADGSSLVSVGMMRPWNGSRFSPRDRNKLAGWLPHFRNLYVAMLRSEVAQQPRDANVLLDAACRLVHANQVATTMIANGTLTVRRGILHLSGLPGLARLARRVAVTHKSTAAQIGGHTVVVRPATSVFGVLLHILGAQRVDPAILRALFQLSPEEARLVVALTAGQTPKDIAQRRGVSIATVRTQLRSVFVKTGTERQAELVALASRVAGTRI